MFSLIRVALVMLSFCINENLTKTEVGIAVIGLTMLLLEECGFGDFGKQQNVLSRA